MTEVKSFESGIGVGLFATKSYNAGEIILDEKPLIVFAPKTQEQVSAVREQFQNIKAEKKKSYETPIHDLDIPSTIDGEQKNKFRGMLLAAATYALVEDEGIKVKVQQLYAPTLVAVTEKSDSTVSCSDHEKGVISLAEEAFSYLKRQAKSGSKLSKLITESPMECKKIMLIWSCNAFKGGYIYTTTSRINHSCDFNAVVSSDTFANDGNGQQIIRAASRIQTGDEIAISYLGSFNYADFKIRNERLMAEKFFYCGCKRCKRDRSLGDVCGSIPCPMCHPREGRYLDEDIQYDDGEVEVNYCMPRCMKVSDDNLALQYKYTCSKCGEVDVEESLLKAMDTAIDRAMSHLDQGIVGQSEIDDDESERATKIEMTERLTCLATSVLGAKHWTTNLLMFVMLSAKLSSLHATMLCKSASGQKNGKDSKGGDDEDPDLMNDIAECIDSLERVVSFVQSLNIKSHFGHLVGNVSVGVARVLVGFGDLKSMKYGSSFASSVYDEYFKLGFEGEGMAKVVDTLMNAWKRKESDDTKQPKKKRQKT